MGNHTELHILRRGFVTAVRYCDELPDSIVRVYTAAVDPAFVLMSDNSYPHRDVIIYNYLQNGEIAHIRWSVYSPELNSTEHPWDVLGRAMCKRSSSSSTLTE